MSLTDKESFDNFLDYKADIEYELSLKMSTDNLEYFDLAVLKELHTRNLVNYAFYKKQRETIKMVHMYRENQSPISWSECILYILMVLIIIVVIASILSVNCVVVWSELRCADIPTPFGEKYGVGGDEYDTGL